MSESAPANQTIYYTCAETAKFVREALKRAFPRTVFSVRSKTYSGGASISVHWTDGPRAKRVDRIVKRFEGATFDGMIDLKSYVHSTDDLGRDVSWGSDYIFTTRRLSREAELTEAAAKMIREHCGCDGTPPMDRFGSYYVSDLATSAAYDTDFPEHESAPSFQALEEAFRRRVLREDDPLDS